MPKMEGEAIMDFAFDFFISFIYFYLYLISLKADLSAKTLAVCAACRGRNISLFFFSKKNPYLLQLPSRMDPAHMIGCFIKSNRPKP